MKNFNTFNNIGGAQTLLIKLICWEIIPLWFHVKIYRIDGIRFMYYIWIHECSESGYTQGAMIKILELDTLG
jgi:hypothetical protein